MGRTTLLQAALAIIPPETTIVSNSKLTISALTSGLSIQKESIVKLKASLQDLGDRRLMHLLEQVKLDGFEQVGHAQVKDLVHAERQQRQAELKLALRTVENAIEAHRIKIKNIDDSITAVEGFFKGVFQNHVLNKLAAGKRSVTQSGAKCVFLVGSGCTSDSKCSIGLITHSKFGNYVVC